MPAVYKFLWYEAIIPGAHQNKVNMRGRHLWNAKQVVIISNNTILPTTENMIAHNIYWYELGMVYNNIKHHMLLCIYKRLSSGHQKHQCSNGLYVYCCILSFSLILMKVSWFIGSDNHIIIEQWTLPTSNICVGTLR